MNPSEHRGDSGSRWDAIPSYKLGETPENFAEEFPILHRRVIAKRAIISSYEDTAYPAACIADLLTDLRHLCDGLRFDFAALDRAAYQNYIAENMRWRQDS